MESLNNCPICNNSQLFPYSSCMDHTVSRETFQIISCSACGFKFTNPRPNANEIGKYYEAEEYISHSGTNKGLINKLYALVRSYTIKSKVALVSSLTNSLKKETRSLLDIGCGTGDFLNACRQKGWDVTGIEPSEVARKNAKEKFGITPLPQEKLFDIKEKKFHVITLWHVLEHIYELDKTLQHIQNLLHTNGTLLIAVPNCNSWDAKKYGTHWAAWDVPRHIYHFTENDIQKLFRKYSFRLYKTLPMKFDSYYVSLLSEKYKTGRSNFISGFWNGFVSNLNAEKKEYGFSSQIYILKKEII